jgi:rfaE bifunctional protein kinase chain/domain
MDERRLQSLLERFPAVRVLVLGDFFLDFYLDIDRALSEVSLETGLEAYQVVRVRSSPGAAGTVTSNLRALDVQVTALGVVGDDGMGYELLCGLRSRGVNVEPLIQVADRFTPTYTKPMLKETDGHIHELHRLDIKNRQPLPAEVEEQITTRLRDLVPYVDGIVVADQVQERNCGAITDRVRAELAELGAKHPQVAIAVDSRVRIGEYRNVIVKPNAREALGAMHADGLRETIDRAAVETRGRALCQQNGRPVFVTVGADGILVFDASGMTHVAGIHVPPPIDIVGAGDSVMAGIVSALSCGASPAEAALVGNLVASITIQQIGTTGTATRKQVLARFGDVTCSGCPTFRVGLIRA